MSSSTMRGMVYSGDRRVQVRDFPVPCPGIGEVLVQIKCAAVCGSDLHKYRRPAAWLADKDPWIPGHEPAGVVVALGECCSRVRVGDRVSVYHYVGCGHCAQCLSGTPQFCAQAWPTGEPETVGPNADYMVIPERNCLLLPDELDFEDGALIACIAGTCFAALRKLEPNGEDTLAIFGLGPVGLAGVIMAKAMGARVIGIDLAKERLELAEHVGADYTVNPQESDLLQTIVQLTAGLGVNMALETSGSPAAHQAVIDILCTNGKAAIVGFGSRTPSVNLTSIIQKQAVLMGSYVMPISYYWDLVGFWLRHDLSIAFKRIITHRFSIEDAAEAFRVADSGRAGKVLFVWA